MSLRILFAGTPEFAATHLQALLDSEHQILAVFTQPDRPSGRGRHIVASPVKALALEHSLDIYQPCSLKEESTQALIKSFNADLLIVVAYGLILPTAVLSIPRLGCINVHASLLPRWRGAAPVQRAIEHGDTETGISVMQMDTGLDTGDILWQRSCTISPEESSGELLLRLADLGAETLLKALVKLERHALVPQPQDSAQASYAAKITKQEARLDWNVSATDLANKVRAFNPWPVAQMEFKGEVLRVWRALAVESDSPLAPGSIECLDQTILQVRCAEGSLRLLQVQRPGKKIQCIQEFIQGKGL